MTLCMQFKTFITRTIQFIQLPPECNGFHVNNGHTCLSVCVCVCPCVSQRNSSFLSGCSGKTKLLDDTAVVVSQQRRDSCGTYRDWLALSPRGRCATGEPPVGLPKSPAEWAPLQQPEPCGCFAWTAKAFSTSVSCTESYVYVSTPSPQPPPLHLTLSQLHGVPSGIARPACLASCGHPLQQERKTWREWWGESWGRKGSKRETSDQLWRSCFVLLWCIEIYSAWTRRSDRLNTREHTLCSHTKHNNMIKENAVWYSNLNNSKMPDTTEYALGALLYPVELLMNAVTFLLITMAR